MDRVFVVVGSSGYYSDALEWVVAGFSTREAADHYAAAAKKRAAELEYWHCETCDEGRDLHRYYECEAPEPLNEFDEDCSWRSDEVTYGVAEVPWKG